MLDLIYGIFEYFYNKIIFYLLSTRISRYLIDFNLKRHFNNKYKKYRSYYYPDYPNYNINENIYADSSKKYANYIDFLIRKTLHKYNYDSTDVIISPCEGSFVHINKKISNLISYSVKSKLWKNNTLFNTEQYNVNDSYYYTYLYLSPMNYHRFHSPVSGIIMDIHTYDSTNLPLNPKFYFSNNKEYPLYHNSRTTFVFNTKYGLVFMTCIGALGVPSVKLADKIAIGKQVNIGEEIGNFIFGSSIILAYSKPFYIKNIKENITKNVNLYQPFCKT